ncbi:bacterioferritin-associated ferredoxin [Streptomyces smyrnaeus]|uniref:(2Fe-2S)-binding protein n=1 Tax=Streptomyces TaxID=1883 RepID=UPI000C19C014|nr:MULTISPECIES: (2Fe-2S)-binding protein [unclassified Streptomyces]MBQ0868719.1 (2Fe-2S)-binding protein [Streptomyces sp. RK75]MBQ1124699.1 (2Fe-2S)-binding protein [Streptomyces sp. B15]MBQ1161285.1 (2Fe-2S)-binding protein [Streptomyces sp. A73]
MYVCSCFGITEEQVKEHAAAGACTPRQIASASKAGTDCGSCVRRIQGILGRGQCPRRAALDRGEPPLTAQQPSTATAPEPAEVAAMAAQAPAAAAARVAA